MFFIASWTKFFILDTEIGGFFETTCANSWMIGGFLAKKDEWEKWKQGKDRIYKKMIL